MGGRQEGHNNTVKVNTPSNNSLLCVRLIKMAKKVDASAEAEPLCLATCSGGLDWPPPGQQEGGCEEDGPDVCWVCLDGGSEANPLLKLCQCPSRLVHSRCIARWQLQQAGKT